MKNLGNFGKSILSDDSMSNIYGGQTGGDPCCSATVFSDGTWATDDEDCEAEAAPFGG